MIPTFQHAFHLAHRIFPRTVCLEFGVYIGATFVWQAKQIRRRYTNSTLIGFDSWEGLPPETEGVWAPDRHAEGKYKARKEIVLQKLGTPDPRFHLVDGFFSQSLTEDLRQKIGPVAFINIDVDIYSSTIELLNWVKPLLQIGTVIYWDDWKDPRMDNPEPWGEHKAWADWLIENPDIEAETFEINPLNQRYMVVTRVNGKRMKHDYLAKLRNDAFKIATPTLWRRVLGL